MHLVLHFENSLFTLNFVVLCISAPKPHRPPVQRLWNGIFLYGGRSPSNEKRYLRTSCSSLYHAFILIFCFKFCNYISLVILGLFRLCFTAEVRRRRIFCISHLFYYFKIWFRLYWLISTSWMLETLLGKLSSSGKTNIEPKLGNKLSLQVLLVFVTA